MAYVKEAWSLRHVGCLYLLDYTNGLLQEEMNVNLNVILTEKNGFKLEVTLLGGDILLYRCEMAEIAVHPLPLGIGGTIIQSYVKIEQKQERCRVIDTLRCMVSVARGEPIDGPMLAIEAGMMQRAVCEGLHLHSIQGAVYFRDYLTPDDVNAFDLFGGNMYGPLKHYLDYPITNRNRELYRAK